MIHFSHIKKSVLYGNVIVLNHPIKHAVLPFKNQISDQIPFDFCKFCIFKEFIFKVPNPVCMFKVRGFEQGMDFFVLNVSAGFNFSEDILTGKEIVGLIKPNNLIDELKKLFVFLFVFILNDFGFESIVIPSEN